MKIVVENNLIETKDIVSIEESGHRMHGFIIYLIDGTQLKIEQEEEYYMTTSSCANINDAYRSLREKVEEEWSKDKTDIPIFKLHL